MKNEENNKVNKLKTSLFSKRLSVGRIGLLVGGVLSVLLAGVLPFSLFIDGLLTFEGARYFGSLMFYGGLAACIYVGLTTKFRADWQLKKQIVTFGSFMFILLFVFAVVEAPAVNALTPLPSDRGPSNSSAYKFSVPFTEYQWIIAQFRDGTYYAINGSDWNIMTIVEPWQPVAPWAALAANLTALEEQVLASTTSGKILLNEVAYNYNLTIPANVTVIESYNGLTRQFINSANTQGSPYTISVDTVQDGYYLAQDSADRFIDEWSSLDYSSVLQSTVNSLKDGGLIQHTPGNFTANSQVTISHPFITIAGAGSGQDNNTDRAAGVTTIYTNGCDFLNINAAQCVNLKNFLIVGQKFTNGTGTYGNGTLVTVNSCVRFASTQMSYMWGSIGLLIRGDTWTPQVIGSHFQYDIDGLVIDGNGTTDAIVTSSDFKGCLNCSIIDRGLFSIISDNELVGNGDTHQATQNNGIGILYDGQTAAIVYEKKSIGIVNNNLRGFTTGICITGKPLADPRRAVTARIGCNEIDNNYVGISIGLSQNVSGVAVVGNTITNSVTDAIHIYEGTGNVLIDGNCFENNTNTIIDHGSKTRIGTNTGVVMTFGDTTVRSTPTDLSSGDIKGSVFIAPANGYLYSLTAYLNATATSHVKLLLYENANGTLIGASEQRTLTTAIGERWLTFIFPSPVAVKAATYYDLAVFTDGNVQLFRDNVAVTYVYSTGNSYPTVPANVTFSTGAYSVSIYGTYLDGSYGAW